MRDLTTKESDRLIAFTHRHPGPVLLRYVQTGIGIAVFVTDANGVRADLTEWERM